MTYEVDVTLGLPGRETIRIFGKPGETLACESTICQDDDPIGVKAGLAMLDSMLLACVNVGFDITLLEEHIRDLILPALYDKYDIESAEYTPGYVDTLLGAYHTA
jgi:hypothetical protein